MAAKDTWWSRILRLLGAKQPVAEVPIAPQEKTTPIEPTAPIAGLPDWAAAIGTIDRYTRFLGDVERYFRDAGDVIRCEDGVVVVESGAVAGAQCGLTNLLKTCSGHDESEWPALVATHFDRVLASSESMGQVELTDYADVHERLVLRPLDESAMVEAYRETLQRPLVPGLVALLAVDLPESAATIKPAVAAEWGVALEDAFERAEHNTLRLSDASANWHDVDGVRLMIVSGQSIYNSATLTKVDRFEGLLTEHGAFVSTPTRDGILGLPFKGLDTLRELVVLFGVTQHFEQKGPGSVSRRVWWCRRSGGGLRWIELPYELTDGRISVNAPDELAEYLNRIADSGSK